MFLFSVSSNILSKQAMFSKLLEMEYIFSMQRSVRWCFCKFMSTDGTSVTVCRWKMLTKDRLLLQPVETLYFGVHIISVPAWQWIKFSDNLWKQATESNAPHSKKCFYSKFPQYFYSKFYQYFEFLTQFYHFAVDERQSKKNMRDDHRFGAYLALEALSNVGFMP